jgi:hypothetical protein
MRFNDEQEYLREIDRMVGRYAEEIRDHEIDSFEDFEHHFNGSRRVIAEDLFHYFDEHMDGNINFALDVLRESLYQSQYFEDNRGNFRGSTFYEAMMLMAHEAMCCDIIQHFSENIEQLFETGKTGLTF